MNIWTIITRITSSAFVSTHTKYRMCGIAGYLTFKGEPPGDRVLLAMGEAMAHRGPDDARIYSDEDTGIGLSFRRLAILDLTKTGAQPMSSASGRYIISYNGEIYNHLDLRAEIERNGKSPIWRGTSDTETLLALIEWVGIEAALPRLNGMFGISIWDRLEKTLTLARDRIGEKPLYYGWVGSHFSFASELKALRPLPGFRPQIDKSAADALLRYACIPAPQTIYMGINKLIPGHFLQIHRGQTKKEVQSKPYWQLQDTVKRTSSARMSERSYNEIVDQTEATLTEVIKSQTLSDVPLGVFLSGGIDSSLVTALMQKSTTEQVKSFSLGFEIERFNEATHARDVATHLGTDHTEFIVSENDALDVIPDIANIFCEPFADSSQIPTILLSRMTRKKVTVALSGDGGDEMFGGYNRHIMVPRVWKTAKHIPRGLRQMGAWLGRGIQSSTGERTAEWFHPVSQRLKLPTTAVDRIAHLSGVLGQARDMKQLYELLISSSLVPGSHSGAEQNGIQSLNTNFDLAGLSDAEKLMYWDTLWYLPDDIMVKVDRSAMSSSLETRAPFLDPRTIELAWSLPISAKISKGTGKTVLRDILYKHVPRSLVDRPKKGFSVPLDTWLRGPLLEWSGDTLEQKNCLHEFGIEDEIVKDVWRRHQSGKENLSAQLWPLLMLADWTRVHRHA